MKNYQNIIKLGKTNKGIIQTKDIHSHKIPKDYLRFAVEDGVIEKVAYGIYILKDIWVDDYVLLQLRRPAIIFSHATSAYFNGLTTRDPHVISFTVPTGNNISSLMTNELKAYYCSSKKYKLGIIEIPTMHNNLIKIYDSERTICDLFSPRYVGDSYIGLESLKNYLNSKNKNIFKLMQYAKKLGVEKTVREKIEAMNI